MFCINLMLQEEDKQARNSRDGGDNTVGRDDNPANIQALQSTLADCNPSYVSYLVAIGKLIQLAFSHKKGKRFFIIR